MEAHRLPKEEVIKMLETELADFENQYGMPSHVFMEKWRNFELDEKYEFFIWESSYKKYLQLNHDLRWKRERIKPFWGQRRVNEE